MPDRYGETDAHEPIPDDVWAAQERRKLAVANCELCDDDGYRGTTVCDHVDRSATAKRGLAMVRAALNETKAKRGAK